MWPELHLTVILLVVTKVTCTLLDIRTEVTFVVRQHNMERSSSMLKAADMLEMWDDQLASEAGRYASQCRYQYPSIAEFPVGSNLYYEQGWVHGPKTTHRLVKSALKTWTRVKDFFVYGTHCQRACSYVQMIVARADRIGCALSTCSDLVNFDSKGEVASLLVCFYSPQQSLLDSLPFKRGYMCSECPPGNICRSGLCSKLGNNSVPSYLQDSPLTPQPGDRQLQPIDFQDKLSTTDEYYLTVAHNRLRTERQRDPVEWDEYLQRWASWVIRCNMDYPGPAHCFTNFHRLDQGAQAYTALFEWVSEGDNTWLQLDHACRSPRDRQPCNHYTNILQPMLTSVGCAAKACPDQTRQLVCLYDNKVDRVFASPPQPDPWQYGQQTRPRPASGQSLSGTSS